MDVASWLKRSRDFRFSVSSSARFELGYFPGVIFTGCNQVGDRDQWRFQIFAVAVEQRHQKLDLPTFCVRVTKRVL